MGASGVMRIGVRLVFSVPGDMDSDVYWHVPMVYALGCALGAFLGLQQGVRFLVCPAVCLAKGLGYSLGSLASRL